MATSTPAKAVTKAVKSTVEGPPCCIVGSQRSEVDPARMLRSWGRVRRKRLPADTGLASMASS